MVQLLFRSAEVDAVDAARRGNLSDDPGESADLSLSVLHLSEEDLRQLVTDIGEMTQRYVVPSGTIEVSLFTSATRVTDPASQGHIGDRST